MTQPSVQTQGVAGAPSLPLPAEVTGLFEIGNDLLGGALGDVAGRGKVTQTRGGVTCDGQQHTRMAGEEAPPSGLLVHDQPHSFAAALPGTPAGNLRKPGSPIVRGEAR